MEKKRQIAAVLILLALIGVIAYRHSTGKDLEKYEASFFDVFDTQTQIIGYASSKEQFSEQMSLIKDKFQYYNDLYDIYHDYEGMNNIKTINDNAGIQPVKVDEEIIELLKLGITMDEKTDGKKKMLQTWGHILNGLCDILKNDPKIRSDVFDQQFTEKQFADILFSLILVSMIRQDYNPSSILMLINKTLY